LHTSWQGSRWLVSSHFPSLLPRSINPSAATVAAAAIGSAANTSAIPLRILPVGASVTFGVGSSAGNSYRKDLRNMLTAQPGNPHLVNFVGRNRNGDFPDNQVEATSGFVISQIVEAARVAAPVFLPNLVLIEAGTNNCNSGGTVPLAGANLTALINDLFRLSPGVTVIMAALLENKSASQDACRVDINRQYEGVASGLEAQGKKFLLVNMRSPDGPTTADLFDSRHPNDRGYAKMAVVWDQGIQMALERGFIASPAENGIPLDGTTGEGGNGTAVGMSGQSSVMGTTGMTATSSAQKMVEGISQRSAMNVMLVGFMVVLMLGS
jgi:hypothetical protein